MRRAPLFSILLLVLLSTTVQAKPPIYIAFHWHMHQPIYWPYESLVATASHNPYGFDVVQVHTDRTGPYTAWPIDAVESGKNAGLAHLGAQVSFSGSLMENLDSLAAAGQGFSNWTSRWRTGVGWSTSEGNRRIDLVAFGYHHPLMALVSPRDIGLQIEMHRLALERHFGATSADSKGIFPPETAFAPWMIPALVDAGIEWAVVDNIHFDRARTDYPYSPGSNLYPPNPSDQRNSGGEATWLQLYDLWAPSQVSAPWGYQPHYVTYLDPDSGQEHRIIAVPAARYEGNEDARGGFGALQYEQVLSQYEALNVDDDHPMLILLHHDGDNYGGGTDSYYHGNFANFITWLQANPSRFVCTTVQDYLDQFPPEHDDVIHLEPGSWSGADNGDPEFLKWNGDPGAGGYSPDRVSWAVVTATHNRVATAESILPISSVEAIVDGDGNHTEQAYHYYLNAQTSCYWYWDGAEGGKWDSHPARACNQAIVHTSQVLTGSFADTVCPSIYTPQREPYNPGGLEWGTSAQPSDFVVWTFVDDVSGVERVVLRYRVDDDGQVDPDNLLRSGSGWQEIAMTPSALTPTTDPLPSVIATQYEAEITGQSQTLIDYYVEAEDTLGNVGRSPVFHVFVGQQGAASTGVAWTPRNPCRDDLIVVSGPKPGWLHWGTDNWTLPDERYWPEGTTAWSDGLAVETPLEGPDEENRYWVELGPFNLDASVGVVDFVIHHSDNSWDNNNGADYHIAIRDTCIEEDMSEPSGDLGPGDETGPPDAGPDNGSDAMAPDLGFDQEGGPIETADEDSPPETPGAKDEGCSCGTTGAGAPEWSLWLLIGLPVMIARRRRAR
ncbi:MAG: hypothetical protein JW797_03155 [Bradymonadales bacterium]|nr:hypothetical protein [Bradymonadales bacterium]